MTPTERASENWRLAFKFARSCDDEISENYLSLVDAAENFVSAKGYKFSTLARKVIRQQALRHRRKRERVLSNAGRANLQRHSIDDHPPCVQFDFESIANRELVDRIRNGISFDSWSLLVLRYGLDGHAPLSCAEIGALMGRSESWIFFRVRAAIRKARAILGA